MGILADIAEIAPKLFAKIFGFTNLEVGESWFYNLIILLLIGWLSLFLFFIVKKRYILKEWKIPHLVNIGIIIIVSLISFTISYLFMLNLSLFLLLDNATTYSSPPFSYTMIFMGLYIYAGLSLIHEKLKIKEDKKETIPKELELFLPRSIILLFGLIIIAISQLLFLNFLKLSPFNYYLADVNGLQYAITSVLFLIMGIVIIIFALKQSIIKKIDEYIKKNPRIPFIIFSILTLLLALSNFIHKKDILNGAISSVVSLLLILISIFFNKIKQIVKKDSKLTLSPN